MAKRVADRSAKHARLRAKGPSVRKVSAQKVAAALGAERVEGIPLPKQSPVAFLALRQEVLRRLRSTGGRPKLAGTTRRQKIPLQDSDWERLGQIAESLRGQDIKATPGQVASTILHRVLEKIELDDIAEQSGS